MRHDLLRCVNLIDAHVTPARNDSGDRLLLPWVVFSAFIAAAVGGVVWL